MILQTVINGNLREDDDLVMLAGSLNRTDNELIDLGLELKVNISINVIDLQIEEEDE